MTIMGSLTARMSTFNHFPDSVLAESWSDLLVSKTHCLPIGNSAMKTSFVFFRCLVLSLNSEAMSMSCSPSKTTQMWSSSKRRELLGRVTGTYVPPCAGACQHVHRPRRSSRCACGSLGALNSGDCWKLKDFSDYLQQWISNVESNIVADAIGHMATGSATTFAGAVVLVKGAARTARATYSTTEEGVV